MYVDGLIIFEDYWSVVKEFDIVEFFCFEDVMVFSWSGLVNVEFGEIEFFVVKF